mgnify:FL=1
MEVKVSKLSALYKELYNVCRRKVHPDWQNDPDAVKALRDYATTEYCGKTYDKMTAEELKKVIEIMAATDDKTKEYATPKMLNTLKYYAISVAIVYANMTEWEYYDAASGVMLTGEDLRKFLRENFYTNGVKIPSYLVRRLFEEWINPHTNEFLIEGKYRKTVRNPNVVYYERLSKQEARYLINRYSAIYNQLYNKSITGESQDILNKIRSN